MSRKLACLRELYPVSKTSTSLYEQLELSGLSTVVDGVLVNPANISLLEYNDNKMVADAAGDGGKFTFMRADVSGFERKGNTWKVPDGEFDAFKELALAPDHHPWRGWAGS